MQEFHKNKTTAKNVGFYSDDLLEPMSFTDVGMATDCIVLISYPDYEDDIECCSGVIEEFRHYRFHTCK